MSTRIAPKMGYPVSTRNYSLNDLARQAWGPEFAAPDRGVYQFSNGRQFQSTDLGVTGFYKRP